MRYFAAFLVMLSVSMVALGCGEKKKPPPKTEGTPPVTKPKAPETTETPEATKTPKAPEATPPEGGSGT